INPAGRKKLARAIEEGNLRMVQDAAIRQAQDAAHMLDVNVGVSGIDEFSINFIAAYGEKCCTG
ncbi:MAG: hypothetical protein JXL84_10085, partial [Deltaproteobacteria bacterium]|nr:hypothetical protein [Deltaproteobacteria bacterium]